MEARERSSLAPITPRTTPDNTGCSAAIATAAPHKPAHAIRAPNGKGVVRLGVEGKLVGDVFR